MQLLLIRNESATVESSFSDDSAFFCVYLLELLIIDLSL